MDPQQRMLLEICYEAVENTGISLEKFSGTDTAVYAGKLLCHLEVSDTYSITTPILRSSSYNSPSDDRGLKNTF